MGTVQRATKTPATMPSEMINGEKPTVTSLVGASAAPSHAPAPSPHATPRRCSDLVESLVGVDIADLPDNHQQPEAQQEDSDGQPELRIGEDGFRNGWFQVF